MAQWTPGLFPDGRWRLRASAGARVGIPALAKLLREDLPLAAAFSGHPPAGLTPDDLDAVG